MNQNTPSAGAESRRNFIKKAAATAAVVAANPFKTPVYGQAKAPSTGRTLGANDRLVLGYIGVGGQGMAHVRHTKTHAANNNVVQAAVCDIWTKRIEGAKDYIEKDSAGADVKTYDDYRKLLERKDIDAVFISTVDHWHTKIAIDAMNAGKHVYVEKPMTRYLEEAFQIYDACQRTGKILQVGSQGSSDAKWHKAAEMVREGKLGPLVMSVGSYMRNNPKGEWNYKIDPDAKADNLNWDAWMGPVHKKISFNPDHYFRWRKYYPYCAGLLGDLMPHKLHPYMIATGNPEFPLRVSCIGNKKVGTDRNTPDTPERDVPEIVQLMAEFPSGLTMVMSSSTVNGVGTQEMIRGHKATIYMAGNAIELKPERPFADEIDSEDIRGIQPGESVPEHHKNWFASMRGTAKPNAGIDLAVKVQTVISLAEMAERLNIVCMFDEKTRKITDGSGKVVKPITYGTLPLS